MTVLITRRDWEALPEGAPYELHDGVLVKQPSPRFGHQRVQIRLLRKLVELLGDDGRVVAGPVDVLVDEITVFVPDIVVLDDVPDDGAQYVGIPRAVFEIVSPSTESRDREFKTRRLLGLGVREVWLIDPRGPRIERVSTGGTHAVEGDERVMSEAIEDFALGRADVL